MAILSNSWAQHLKSQAGNEEANKNMKAFSEAFAPATTVAERVAALVEEIDAAVLLAGSDGTVLRTHSWTKFGGTRSRASVTVACLIGTGSRANVVIVDCSRAVVATIVSIPSEIDIAGCVAVQDLEDLATRAMMETASPAPAAANPTATSTPPTAATPTSTPATPTARTTRSRNAAAAAGTTAPAPQASGRGGRGRMASFSAAATTATTARNIELTSAFLMAPFLSDALLDEKSAYPLELIILAREAAVDFDNRHRGVAGFGNTSAIDHANAFANWAFALHLGKLNEVRYTIDPDDNELRTFAESRHQNCILAPLGSTSGAPTPGNNNDVLKNLSEGLKRMGEAADQANLLTKEHLRLREETEDLKKDRIKDMHSSISNMILMASATDPDQAGEFCNSFKSFYNSKNQGYADMELHHQFDAKNFQNVGFAEGTVLAMWSGLLKRSNPTAPSNCTPFAFRELQPMNMNQKSRSLICTMINQKGGLAQSAEEIKKKAKQNIEAPSDYNEMIFQLKAFVALIEILFGDESITAEKLKTFVQLIEAQSIYYKGVVVCDEFFPTKVLWTVCTRFQLYLESCTRAEDREEVDNSLIDFSNDHRDIILNRFNANLPASFKAVELGNDKDADDDAESEKITTKKRKKRNEKEQHRAAEKKPSVKNDRQCSEFKLREGELWTQFAGMHLDDRAKMKGTIMCTRWHTRGDCFTDCKNKASHVICSEIPPDAKQGHLRWMQKCRRE